MSRIWIVVALITLSAAGGLTWQSLAAHQHERTAPSDAPLKGSLSLVGSSTLEPLMRSIAARFTEKHPEVHFDIRTGGSNRGIADARAGLCDIGMASRLLRGDEDDLFSFPVARDGVALLVHRDNPVRSLEADQVTALFTARKRNWKEVGGADASVRVLDRSLSRSERELFLAFYNLKADAIRAADLIGDNEVGLRAVAADPGAITYMSVGASERARAQGQPLKMLPIAGVSPTSATVRSGAYPFSRPLMLVTPRLPVGLARDFIEFSLSSQVTDLVEKHNYIPHLD